MTGICRAVRPVDDCPVLSFCIGTPAWSSCFFNEPNIGCQPTAYHQDGG